MKDDHKWKITSNGRRSQTEDKLNWKTTETGSRYCVTVQYGIRSNRWQPPMEDDHKWKITSNGRQSQMEEKLYWKTTSTGRQESGVAHFWGSFWNSKCWSWKDSIFSYVCNFFILIVVDLTSAYISLYQLTFPLLSNIEYGKCYDVKIWQWWNQLTFPFYVVGNVNSGKCLPDTLNCYCSWCILICH